MSVTIANEVTPELLAAVERLLPQLTASYKPPTHDELVAIVRDQDLFVARDGGTIVGIGTLATYRTPVGVHAWIEDVVVDQSIRGRGLGEAMTRAMIERARELGAETIALTSSPLREPANRLYQRCGFAPWPTNLYRIRL